MPIADQQITMDRLWPLPYEMHLEIFRKLSLKDILNCKLVSKSWYQFVSYNLKVSRLIVSSRQSGRLDAVPEVDEVEPALFYAQFDSRILMNLRYLKISLDDKRCAFELAKLNRFQQLIELEIDCSLTGTQSLTLPLLKRFSLLQYNFFCTLSIEAPRLASFRYHGKCDRLYLRYPETVVELYTDLYGKQLEPFRNVEHLEGSSVGVLYTDTLTILANLKRLHFSNRFESIYESSEFGLERYGQVKHLLDQLLQQRRALGKHQLRIFFVGIELVDGKEIDEYGFESKNEEHFYLKNQQLLADNLAFVFKVNYTRLLEAGQVPSDYFARFSGLRSVETDGRIVDQEHFFNFLKQLNRQLEVLNLKNAGLEQATFYDRLPKICGSLTNFLIKETEKRQLNYGFLSQLAELHLLHVHQTLGLPATRSLLNSFKTLKHLSSLELRLHRTVFNIWKKYSDNEKYDVTCNDQKTWNLSFEQLVDYFEQLGTRRKLGQRLSLQFSCCYTS